MDRYDRYFYLVSQGFLRREAMEFSKTSDAGLNAPYFQSMIRSRRSLQAYAANQNWTKRQYTQYIHEQYIKSGFYKTDIRGRHYPDVWRLLRYWEDRARQKGIKYESPYKQKGWIGKPRALRKGTPARARADRRHQLRERIKVIDDELPSARGIEKAKLETERVLRMKELRSLRG